MIEFLKKEGNSKLQEAIAEYAFLKDLLLDGARNNKKILISRSDFDAFGYDVLAQIEGSSRIVKLQLKATNGKNNVWDIHKSLIEDESGNVVLIKIKGESNCVVFEYYTILGEKRELILARKPRKEHSKKCKLNKGDMTKVELTELFEKILNTPNSK